jgi:hypothetical protein
LCTNSPYYLLDAAIIDNDVQDIRENGQVVHGFLMSA